jgi:class 3 adenylate cyclase
MLGTRGARALAAGHETTRQLARQSPPPRPLARPVPRHRTAAPARVSDESATATFLFTDIEGSTRLWEREPGPMRRALARHDALSRQAVAAHRGQLVKTTGDGIHAVFDDAVDALHAVLALLQAVWPTHPTASRC